MCELIAQSKQQAGLSVAAMCQALGISRATYYRWQSEGPLTDRDMALRDQIQRIALEMPFYGYRRMTHELKRRGFSANHKRVLRLMREDNLLFLRNKRWVGTTNSNHPWPVYSNLVPELVVDGLDQLWRVDITYIRAQREFLYLAVVLDAYSRRCIGWALQRSLEAELALAALHMALRERTVCSELVHHSDQGVQYACQAYTQLLKDHQIQISMGRKGNPYDNAQVESFIKTLKYEEVYLFEYQSLAEAKARIGHFLEQVYNRKRLHSALGYVPPVEFEQLCEQPHAA